FTLYNVSEKAVLIISYVGYKTQEITLNGKSSVSITMQEDSKALDEIVVVGYGTQKKASLTSAISQIKGEEAFKDRGINNVTVALQGEIPGLIVQRSSTRPGSEGATMKIRGDISVNGNSSPLVLIDGIAGSLDELNQMEPNDIENISVLKDASAAIYGARSASGVLLVTTKRGKKGQAKISYSGAFSTTVDGIQPPLATNAQWMDMFYEAQYQDARAANPTLTERNQILPVFNWWILIPTNLGGIDASGHSWQKEELWYAMRNGTPLTLNTNGKIQRLEPHYLMDELYGQATSQRHSVSISGGDDKFGYMASLGFADNQSQLKVAEDGEKKYSARLNMDYQASKLLKLETGMSYEKRNITTPRAGIGTEYNDPWFWPVYNEAGNPYDTFSGIRNPIGRLVYGGQAKTDYTTFRSSLKAILDLSELTEGLSLSASGSYKSVGKDIQTMKTKIQWYDWENNKTGNADSPGSLTEELNKWESITLGAFTNYERKFNDVHQVFAMLGMTGEEENWKKVTASRNKGPLYEGSDLVDLNVMVSGTDNGAGGGQSSWAFLSYITRLNYSYMDKYLVEFLGRRDGSSKLYPEQRWKNFYSVSAGWVVTQEEFMKGITWLDFLKFRYNFGKTGSVEGIGNYEQYATVSTGSAYFGETLTAQSSLKLGGITSANRTWETLNSHDAGLDFTLLNNRLSGTFDWFQKTNEGMFIDVTYPSLLGASAPKTNNGKFRTDGWEFSLNWRDKIGNLTYNVGGFLADSKSKVMELLNNQNVPVAGKNSNRLIGMPREAIYVWQTDGVFQTQAEADAYYEKYYWNADHTGPKSGNILPAPAATGTNRLRQGARILVDANKDGAITNDDLVYAGDAAPRLNFGLKAGLEWKGFDINAFFQGVLKQKVLRTGSIYAPWVVNYTNQIAAYMGKMWSDIDILYPNGEAILVSANTSTDYTISSRDANFNRFNYQNKDVSVQDSRYIRLKSLVVGYTLPKTLTQKAALSKVRIYFSGDDLWEWTKIKDGYDPEQGEASNSTFPFSRLLSFGVDITF
ncbi:MAG: TonB-dependent receptor, partial [Mediterranea sp.]|nr:TonB-dependent receptor [Mediterranea sp.]